MNATGCVFLFIPRPPFYDHHFNGTLIHPQAFLYDFAFEIFANRVIRSDIFIEPAGRAVTPGQPLQDPARDHGQTFNSISFFEETSDIFPPHALRGGYESTRDRLKTGLIHYKSTCLACTGANDVLDSFWQRVRI